MFASQQSNHANVSQFPHQLAVHTSAPNPNQYQIAHQSSVQQLPYLSTPPNSLQTTNASTVTVISDSPSNSEVNSPTTELYPNINSLSGLPTNDANNSAMPDSNTSPPTYQQAIESDTFQQQLKINFKIWNLHSTLEHHSFTLLLIITNKNDSLKLVWQQLIPTVRVFVIQSSLFLLHTFYISSCAAEVNGRRRKIEEMSAHSDDFYDFYSDTELNVVADKKLIKVKENQAISSYMHALLIIFLVILVFVAVKCLKRCIKSRQEKGDLKRSAHLENIWHPLIAALPQICPSNESINTIQSITIESNDLLSKPFPSAPDPDVLPPSYWEVVKCDLKPWTFDSSRPHSRLNFFKVTFFLVKV